MSDYLVGAAQWRDHHRDGAKGSPPKLLMAAASRALDVLALADEADLACLRAEYDHAPAPRPPSPAPGRSSGLPVAPGAPSPGRTRGR
ncbi:hypothetical protein ACHZ98_29350 [Streptomyces sp. MAR4 CNY-716]